mgnify:CR=1 FL=1
MKIVWNEEALKMIYISEELRKRIEKQVFKLNLKDLERLREYEEIGDAIILKEPGLYEEGGLLIKVVKHKGEIKLVAGVYEVVYAEEHFPEVF